MCFPTDFTVQLRTSSSSSSSACTPLRKRGKTTNNKVIKAIKRTSSSSSTSSLKQKKSVRFSPFNSVAYRHASLEDLQKSWNQRSDIATIKTNIRRDIKALEGVNGKLHQLDATQHSFRGLESGICPTIHKLRKLWVKATQQNVLDEQRLQRDLGVLDPQRLGEVARLSSKDAVRCATKMGSLDARHSLKVNNNVAATQSVARSA